MLGRQLRWRVSSFVSLMLFLCACGVDSGASIGEGMLVEENEAADVMQDVSADVLNVKVMEGDVAPGTLSARTTKIFTTMDSARSLLGFGAPSAEHPPRTTAHHGSRPPPSFRPELR